MIVPSLRLSCFSRTPPFSSDEDSSEEEESEEESPQAQKATQPRVLHENATTVKPQPLRAQPCATTRASTPRSAAPRPSAQHSEAHQAPVVSVSRTQVTALESESDWTEGSEMEEIEIDQLQKHTDQNGNVQKTFHSKKLLQA